MADFGARWDETDRNRETRIRGGATMGSSRPAFIAGEDPRRTSLSGRINAPARGGAPMGAGRGFQPEYDYGEADIDTDPYAFGGNGAVARAPGPQKQQTNIAGGISRDELVRRMDHVNMTMRGSPTARAAMLGMYSDQVKALDAGELQKNQGNIEAEQLAYKGNMDANMQEAAGRQDYGNRIGLMNREAKLMRERDLASADPEKRELELEKMRTEIGAAQAEALRKKGEYEAGITAREDKGITDLATQLYAGGKGNYASFDDALEAATKTYTAGGNPVRGTTPQRKQDNLLAETLTKRVGTDSFIDEWFTKGFDNAGFGNEGLDPNKVYSAEDFDLRPEDSWVNDVRGFWGMDQLQTLSPKGAPLGYKTPTGRLRPWMPEDAKIIEDIKRRKLGEVQAGQ